MASAIPGSDSALSLHVILLILIKLVILTHNFKILKLWHETNNIFGDVKEYKFYNCRFVLSHQCSLHTTAHLNYTRPDLGPLPSVVKASKS